MSTDYSTYIGPYVQCTVRQIETIEMRRTCPSVSCASHGRTLSADFCHVCGGHIRDVAFPVIVDAVDTYDLQEAIDERLADVSGDAYSEWSRENKAHLWKPNIGDVGRHLDSREPFALHRITPTDMHDELHAFEEYFAPELATLRTAYGEAAVSVYWGIIQDYS